MRAPGLWPWPLRIRTHGRFSVVRDGEPVALDGKRLELLQALVSLGARNVQQSALIEAVWPGMDPQQAQAAFDAAVNELCRALGDASLLVVKGTSVTLDPGQVWIDCLHEQTTDLRESAKAL
jgi:DNA-binding SARP family transcriptional activator